VTGSARSNRRQAPQIVPDELRARIEPLLPIARRPAAPPPPPRRRAAAAAPPPAVAAVRSGVLRRFGSVET
jgi:hypothetical protein